MTNKSKMTLLIIATIFSVLIFQFISIDFKFFSYAMRIRTPKLLAMIISAFCIGSASMAFQSIINNRIVTPCLLGMNALYILIHSSIFLILGSSNILAYSANLSFIFTVLIMAFISSFVYSYLFRKTKYNVLYVLLVGTVLATLFTSLSNSMIRIMDPNEFASLQNKIIPGFNNVNSDILIISAILAVLVAVIFWKDIRLLDVISLGKNQAINLGVDFDRAISRVLLAVTFYIAIATALVGPISFLGLILANIARALFKTYKHSYLMIGSAFLGLLILALGQALIEHVFNFGTTIAVFINIFGGIYFMYLIFKRTGK